MNKIIISITVIAELWYLASWTFCEKLADRFHFSAFDLKLRIEEGAHTDTDTPMVVVRGFHNKILGSIIDSYTHLIHYFDISFLIHLLSPLGLFGFLAGLYYGQEKMPKKLYFLLMASLVIMPLLETMIHIPLPFLLKMLLLALPFCIFSGIGMWGFITANDHKKTRQLAVVVLFLLSIGWIIAFPTELKDICYLK